MILKNKERSRGLLFLSPAKILLIILAAFAVFLLIQILSGFGTARQQISYIPETDLVYPAEESSLLKPQILGNQWYVLKISPEGTIRVENGEGQPIISDIYYLCEFSEDQPGMAAAWKLTDKINDSTLFLHGEVENKISIKVTFIISNNRPRLDVIVNSAYLDHVTVYREAMVASFAPSPSEIYLKNRKIDNHLRSDEYWVDKQGVRFGQGSVSAFIYHSPGISSMQISTRENMLFINLDSYLDHPMITIPYQPDGGGDWIDISASHYKPGMVRFNKFSLNIGTNQDVVPRLMLVPGGYQAGYVFTEHADGGNLNTHRAAYFGSQKITDVKEAVGGFAGHSIPVTKSVFFTDFDNGLDDQSDTNMAEIEYLKFLDQLDSLGSEICLHTPEGGNSTRSSLTEAISFMKERYGSRSWIDHGMYQGNNNREAFSAEGLDSLSQYFAGDLWREYDTRYFWSPAVETIRFANPSKSLKELLLDLQFRMFFSEFRDRYNFLRLYHGKGEISTIMTVLKGYFPRLELNSLRPHKGDSFPTPLYWQNPTYSGEFYSWPTEFDYNGITRKLDGENLKVEINHINRLTEGWGVFFNHGYYVRNGKHDEIMCQEDGKLVINQNFDKILACMAEKRNNGELFLTTVQELLDYWILLEDIRFDYKPDGSVDIINDNNQEVIGLSVAVRCHPNETKISGAEYSYRRIDEDTIIWFDLPAFGTVNLRTIANIESY